MTGRPLSHVCRTPGCEQPTICGDDLPFRSGRKALTLYCLDHLTAKRTCEGNSRSRRQGVECRQTPMKGLPVCWTHGGSAPKWKAISERTEPILKLLGVLKVQPLLALDELPPDYREEARTRWPPRPDRHSKRGEGKAANEAASEGADADAEYRRIVEALGLAERWGGLPE